MSETTRQVTCWDCDGSGTDGHGSRCSMCCGAGVVVETVITPRPAA